MPTGAAGMTPIPPVPLPGTKAPKHNACAGSVLPAPAPRPSTDPCQAQVRDGWCVKGRVRAGGAGEVIGSLLYCGSTGVAQPPAQEKGGLHPRVASAQLVPESRRVWGCR